jgi:amino acid adenylation domain-containing protein
MRENKILDRTGFSQQLELLTYLIEDTDFRTETIGRRVNQAEYPFSFAQQRLWFIEQLQPNTATYNVPVALRLVGSLDVSALGDSINEIVQRHQVLRTTFVSVQGQPMPVVAPSLHIPLLLVDLETLSPRAQEQEVASRATAEAQMPFDLATGPLIRAQLLRLNAETHVLLLNMHHIVTDGWSMLVFTRELAALYEALTTSQSGPLPELTLQYADFAHWQQEQLRAGEFEAQIAYWQRKLGDDLPVLRLPIDRPRPAIQSFRGAKQSCTLPQQLRESLKQLSQRENTTLFMTLLTAFKVLLHRYSGLEDIVVGTPIANRNHLEIEDLIGFFSNTLALRTSVSSGFTFRKLLGQVRKVALEAYAHQDVPFEKLFEVLQPQRDLSYTPLFQAMFVFQEASVGFELPGLKIETLPVDSGTAKFDLTTTVIDGSEGLTVYLEYNTDILGAGTVSRMLSHFQVLLESVVANPDWPIGKLPLLPPAERQALLSFSQEQSIASASNLCLHHQFEAQVAQSPDAIALTFAEQAVSYGELNRRANQLAHCLQSLGVGPETRVGLCVERSPEMMIGVLGILKAGGSYVPLDTAHPSARLTYMLTDAEASVLVTQQGLAAHFAGTEVQSICLDSQWPVVASFDATNPRVEVTLQNLAYVIYTSGSTGKPKGVPISHANVSRLFVATQPWFNFDAQDVWTLFHSYAFDFSVWEMWGALLYGGRLVVVPYWVSRSPDAFYDLLRREQVTVLNQTPSAFRQLIQAMEAAVPDENEFDLRYVIFGGEALELSSLRPWFEHYGDVNPQLVNMYGITETTVHVTYRPLSAADVGQGQGSPIGQTIPDLGVCLLDEYLNLVPIGVPGEVYVAGDGLSRGYLDRPALAASRFMPHPFSTQPGARLYRTGDQARYLPDGQLEFFGRIDSQVQLRGFRVELGEIEAVLAGHEAISHAVVIFQQKPDQRLIAYTVSLAGQSYNVTELRSFLKTKLPDYMIPAVFVPLDAIPLTPNGKVDYHALPLPDAGRPEFAERYVAPQTAMEKDLTQIWREVLGINQIGVHDNFFALGGDSIRSVRIVALAKEKGYRFSLQQLFQHQTIRELAIQLDVQEGVVSGTTRCAPFSLISEADRCQLPPDVVDAYPLAVLQAAMLYHMGLSVETPIYHNVDSFAIRAPFDEAALREATRRAVAGHPILRTSFDMSTFSQPLQLVHETAELSIQVIDLCHLSPEEKSRRLDAAIAREKQERFDLSRAPLIRFHVHRLTDELFQFTLAECHAIFDGWSLTSTLAEIFNTYSALLAGRNPPLQPPPATTYRDFIRLEQEAIKSVEHRAFWQSQLAGFTPLRLPRWPQVSAQSTAPQEPRILSKGLPIPPSLFNDLQALARANSVPLKSVFLAAHVKVMSLVSGQTDLLLGLLTNGRPEEKDGEQIRGLFLNTVPFGIHLVDGTWADLLRQVFEVEHNLLPYRRYPMVALQNKSFEPVLQETVFNYIQFHSLDTLAQADNLEIIELNQGTGANNTHFTLAVSFTLNRMFWREDIPAYVVLQYNANELADEQVVAWTRYYEIVMRAMAANPDERHHGRSRLPESEQQRLLVAWNNTQADYPRHQCIHHLVEARAACQPQAPAVVDATGRLTYGVLNERANQLAHYLQEVGIGPEVCVGVYMERSTDMILSLLAVLKAGGAYVPLDPAYPQERLAFMLADAQMPLLLTRQHLTDHLPPTGTAIVCVDTLMDELAAYSTENPLSGVVAENLAYVIYTSGSTGRPKGIQVQHQGLINLVTWHQETYHLTPDDRTTQLAGPAFDASVWEIWSGLAAGASLHLPPEGTQYRPELLLDWLVGNDISLTFVPTPIAEAVLAQALPADLRLRAVLTGGDQLRRVPAEALPFELVNHYGPTEGTVVTTWAPVTNGAATVGLPPIGRPIANTQVYLLDAHGQPAPIGTPGELYIGGDGLARGYLHRPELTAERFLPDPFSQKPGQRLYRSGDLASYLPAGSLTFLGRVDHQVKIRGLRIELGEIETVLGQCPGVGESIVTVYEATPGDRRLVAYVVPDPEHVPAFDTLRQALREKLPAYMIPDAFMLLEALPLTPNGKIDRRALPQPDGAPIHTASVYVAPQSEIEQKVLEIWQQLLGAEKIGVHDNFFDLGGNSLLLAQMHGKLQKVFGCQIRLVKLFRYATIQALAKYLETAEGEEQPAYEEKRVRADWRKTAAQRQRELRLNRRIEERAR